MILVIIGTQDKPFKRLLDYIENANINDEIIVQSGFTKYESSKMEIFDYCDMQKFDYLINKANIIITHGGVGTIMSALDKNKKVIACARLSKYGEHQNDHQVQIVSNFANSGYLLELKENDSLVDLIEKAKTFVPKKYVSNNSNFINKLKEYIEKV